jgi:basic membrane protein A
MKAEKLWKIGVLLLVAALVLTACAPTAAPAPAAAPQPQPTTQVKGQAPAPAATAALAAVAGKGKFGLVLTGPTDDHTWNQAAYDALMALKAEGVDVTYVERVPDTDAERVLREMASKGYQMIVGHSFGHEDAVFKLAEEFPKVNWAWGGGTGHVAKNVADYDQPFYQASYLVGIIAGHLSKTGKLGAIYGFDIPVCHAMGEAFVAGAKTVNPNATLTATAAGDWYDISKAKEAALAQANVGVDFWVGCGQGPTFGTIETAKDKGGYTTGYVGDMSSSGPSVVLTSIVWNLTPMFKAMMKTTLDGTFSGPYYHYDIKEGALDLKINPQLADKIPPDVMKEVEAAKAKIQSGELVVPFVGK